MRLQVTMGLWLTMAVAVCLLQGMTQAHGGQELRARRVSSVQGTKRHLERKSQPAGAGQGQGQGQQGGQVSVATTVTKTVAGEPVKPAQNGAQVSQQGGPNGGPGGQQGVPTGSKSGPSDGWATWTPANGQTGEPAAMAARPPFVTPTVTGSNGEPGPNVQVNPQFSAGGQVGQAPSPTSQPQGHNGADSVDPNAKVGQGPAVPKIMTHIPGSAKWGNAIPAGIQPLVIPGEGPPKQPGIPITPTMSGPTLESEAPPPIAINDDSSDRIPSPVTQPARDRPSSTRLGVGLHDKHNEEPKPQTTKQFAVPALGIVTGIKDGKKCQPFLALDKFQDLINELSTRYDKLKSYAIRANGLLQGQKGIMTLGDVGGLEELTFPAQIPETLLSHMVACCSKEVVPAVADSNSAALHVGLAVYVDKFSNRNPSAKPFATMLSKCFDGITDGRISKLTSLSAPPKPVVAPVAAPPKPVVGKPEDQLTKKPKKPKQEQEDDEDDSNGGGDNGNGGGEDE